MDLRNEKIVLIRGAGLVGSHVLDQLLREPVREINELVDRLLRLTGSTLKPTHVPEVGSFITQRIGSIDRAKQLIGFEATTSLDESLRRIVAWRREQR